MTRSTLIILTVIATAATAIANVAPIGKPLVLDTKNISIVNKSHFYSPIRKLKVEKCALEDCSDTPSSS
jgi:hypothetical protein